MARLLIRSLCTASSLDCASMKSPCTFLLQPSVLGCQCLVLTPMEQAQSQALPSLLGSLGLDIYCSPQVPGARKREKGLDKAGLDPAQGIQVEPPRCAPGKLQAQGLVSCCSGLFPDRGKGGKKE